MQVFKQLFSNYQRGLRDFSFYKEILAKPFFFSLQFLYLITFVVLFINTLLFVVSTAFILPSLPKHIATIQRRLDILYPKDLIVTIKDGNISINKREPLHLDIPEIKNITRYDHFITFSSSASPLDYADADSMLLITQDSVVYPDVNNLQSPYRVESARNFGDIRMDYPSYQRVLGRLNGFLNMLPVIAPWLLITALLFIPIFGAFIVTAWRMFLLIILTGIILPVARIFGSNYSYKELYRMGMIALSVPITLTLILNMVGIFIPMAFASCFLLWMVIILARISEKKATVQ